MPRRGLKLKDTGLILALTPLLVELVFLAVLTYALNDAEQQAWQYNHTKEVMGAADYLIGLFSISSLALMELTVTHSPQASAQCDEALSKIPVQLDVMRALVKDYPEQVRILDELKVDIDAVAKQIYKHKKLVEDAIETQDFGAHSFPNLRAEKRKLKGSMERIVSKLKQFGEEEKKRHPATFEQAEASRREVKIVITVGVILNIGLAIGLALFFTRGTVRRVNTVTDNAMRLSAGKPLNPQLMGSDEIAYLDSVFHVMAEALAEAARKERAVVEQALDVICSLDSKGRFVSVNPAATQVWGYSKDELETKSLLQLISEGERDAVATLLSEVVKGGGETAQRKFETRIIGKEGAVVETEWSAHWSEADKVLFCVAHDISARKEMERIKQDFMAMVSHDLRSPLTSMQSLLMLLQMNAYGEIDDTGMVRIAHTEQDIERVIRMINDLLDMEKMEAGKFDLTLNEASIAKVIDRSVHSLKALAERQDLVIDVSTDDLRINCDEDRLVQVIVNLLSNAIKFSQKAGTVKVSAVLDDDRVKVAVTDSGVGISEENTKRLFSRYSQLEDGKRRGGTGLGLAICKAIVEAHGGTIGVDSKEGEGSTFWFCLPGVNTVSATSVADTISGRSC